MAFTDDFNRANENLDASANWTVITGAAGAAVVSNNQLAVSTTQSNGLIVSPDEGTADHSVEWTLQNTFTHSYVAVRATDGNNFIGARGWDNRWHIDKCVAGTWTYAHGEWASPPVVGDVARLDCSGNTIKLFVNDVERISITDAFNNTETRQGIVPINSSPDPWIDNYSTDSAATGPQITDFNGGNDIIHGQNFTVTIDAPAHYEYGCTIAGNEADIVSKVGDVYTFTPTAAIDAIDASGNATQFWYIPR